MSGLPRGREVRTLCAPEAFEDWLLHGDVYVELSPDDVAPVDPRLGLALQHVETRSPSAATFRLAPADLAPPQVRIETMSPSEHVRALVADAFRDQPGFRP